MITETLPVGEVLTITVVQVLGKHRRHSCMHAPYKRRLKCCMEVFPFGVPATYMLEESMLLV